MKKTEPGKCPICGGSLRKEETKSGTWIICNSCNVIVGFIRTKRRKNE